MAKQQAKTAPAAPAVHVPKKSSTVTVACKMPTGLILQLCRRTVQRIRTKDGVYEQPMFEKIGQKVHIIGPASPAGQLPKGYKRPLLAPEGGYALTLNVDKDFWDEWLEQNKDTDIVKNKVIYAMPTRDGAEGMSADLEEVRSGLEALTGADDPRVPRSLDPNIEDVKESDAAAA